MDEQLHPIHDNRGDHFSMQPWWRHKMETFSALLAICAGNSPVSGEFLAQRPVTRSFDVFFDVRLIKRLSKHSRGWWFETLSHPLWRHRNEYQLNHICKGRQMHPVGTLLLTQQIIAALHKHVHQYFTTCPVFCSIKSITAVSCFGILSSFSFLLFYPLGPILGI